MFVFVVCLFVCLFACLFVSVFVSLFVCLCVCMFGVCLCVRGLVWVWLAACVFGCLFVCGSACAFLFFDNPISVTKKRGQVLVQVWGSDDTVADAAHSVTATSIMYAHTMFSIMSILKFVVK